MNRKLVLILTVIVIITSIFIIEKNKPAVINPGSVDLTSGLAPEITDPTGFINTDKNISIHGLIGRKVVLVDFWTYSCINCQRTLPYLKAWYAKYKDQGLEIIGIHSPEFEFEKNYENVAHFVQQNGITYPVVLDSNMGTWNAYGNQYWPADYLIDKTGKVVDTHFGEGGYAATEHEIQKLLGLMSDTSLVNPNAVSPTQSNLMSPETYFGSDRNQYFGNGKPGSPGIQTFIMPNGTDLNTFYLSGKWNVLGEYAETQDANEKIVYRFQAKNVYFVAGSSNAIKIRILIDGKETQELTIQQNTLYQVYAGNEFGEHVLEIDVDGAGLQAYTFTFG